MWTMNEHSNMYTDLYPTASRPIQNTVLYSFTWKLFHYSETYTVWIQVASFSFQIYALLFEMVPSVWSTFGCCSNYGSVLNVTSHCSTLCGTVILKFDCQVLSMVLQHVMMLITFLLLISRFLISHRWKLEEINVHTFPQFWSPDSVVQYTVLSLVRPHVQMCHKHLCMRLLYWMV